MNEDKMRIIIAPVEYISTMRECHDMIKQDRKDIKFLSFCLGVMAFVLIRQNMRIKKLEKQQNDPLVEVPAE